MSAGARKPVEKACSCVRGSLRSPEKTAEKCVVEFNKKLQEVIDLGAGDRKTALTWMLQGDMGDSDELDLYAVETFTASRGISYSEFGNALEEELIQIVNDNPSAFGIAA